MVGNLVPSGGLEGAYKVQRTLPTMGGLGGASRNWGSKVPEFCGSGYPLVQLIYHSLQWGSMALCPAAAVGDLPQAVASVLSISVLPVHSCSPRSEIPGCGGGWSQAVQHQFQRCHRRLWQGPLAVKSGDLRWFVLLQEKYQGIVSKYTSSTLPNVFFSRKVFS